MINRELKDFLSVSGLGTEDNIILVLGNGTGGKINVTLFKSSITDGVKPSVKNGTWWVGDVDTGVTAEGRTPEFRKGAIGVEYKYTDEADSEWKLLVNYSDIAMTYEDLTEEEKKELRPTLDDFTEEEIAQLQQPAKDMIEVLNNTNESVKQAEALRVNAEEKREQGFSESKQLVDSAAEAANSAAANATDTATHPTFIGKDNYVYIWNKDTKTYDKTDIYVRGEAFSIKKVYTSISEMNNDISTEFKEGDFCLINTGDVENPENAQLFVRLESGKWKFLVDMSGAIGFTGKTPQISVGSVTISGSYTVASVSLTSDGEDSDGNPKYKLNFIIPRFAFSDLTEEEISILQGPANEMISELGETNELIKAEEALRVSAENARVSAESGRVTAENERVSNENRRKQSEEERTVAETARSDAEELRETAETARGEAETVRATAETGRNTAEKARNDAEKIREANELARKTAETARREAETERSDAETSREEAENDRNEAEQSRETAETERETAETGRVAAENARNTEEDVRIENENARKSAESSRVSAEKLREEAENSRVTDEEERTVAETARESAETVRSTSETSRNESEKARIAAENIRKTQEEARVNEENARNESELQRVNAEQQRSTAETARETAEIAREAAEALRETAKQQTLALNEEIKDNPPKIVNDIWNVYDAGTKAYVSTNVMARGRSPRVTADTTWEVWDDVTGEWVDTGILVSAQYELTKNKVENVLTGDIMTHNHATQLAEALTEYVKKVSGKDLSTNDFTNALKTKLEGLENYDDTAVQNSISAINGQMDLLLGEGASSAIDTFNEIKSFLEGITDAETLTGILENLRTELEAEIPTKVSQLSNDSGYITNETDPTVPNWAKNPTKPNYVWGEIGNRPTKLSEFTNDSGFITGAGKAAEAGKVTGVLSFTGGVKTQFNGSKDVSVAIPTTLPASDVYAWAKAATKPSYSASEVGAIPTGGLKTINGNQIEGSGNIEIPIDTVLSSTSGNAIANKSVKAALDLKADATVLGDYLPLTGGTLTGNLFVTRGASAYKTELFCSTSANSGGISIYDTQGNVSVFRLNAGGDASWRDKILLHASNYSNYAVTLSTDQTITGKKTFAGGSFIINGNDGSSSTNNQITSDYYANGSWNGGKGKRLRNALSFNWYGNRWVIGNVASVDEKSVGFGIGKHVSNEQIRPCFMVSERHNETITLTSDVESAPHMGTGIRFQLPGDLSQSVTLRHEWYDVFIPGYGLAVSNSDDLENGDSKMFFLNSGRYISRVPTGTAPYQCVSTTVNTNLNADMVDNIHGSQMFVALRNAPSGKDIVKYADLSSNTADLADFIPSLSSGTYKISRSSGSELLVRFNADGPAMSTSGLEFLTSYFENTALRFRKTIDNNRVSGPWTTIITNLNIGSQSVNSATKLVNARTIWGQSFNGTANISGNMTGVGTISASGNITTSANVTAAKLIKSGGTSSQVLMADGSTRDDSSFGSNYTLPMADTYVTGGVRVHNTITVGNPNSVSTTSNRFYWVQRFGDGTLVVNVPWTDTITTYSVATTSKDGLLKKLDGNMNHVMRGDGVWDYPRTLQDKTTLVACNGYVTIVRAGTGNEIEINSTDNAILMNAGSSVDINIDANPILSAYQSNNYYFTKISSSDNEIIFNDGVSDSYYSGITIRTYDEVYVEGGDLVVKYAVVASGGFHDASDARVKTNVKDIDASKADKVKLVEFDRTDREHHGYGVIAQELEKVYPEMVNTDNKGFKSVNYNELAMVKIKYLEDKVARLENLINKNNQGA